MQTASDERLTTARKNFLHLFLADPVQLMAKTYEQYEAQEPAFAEPLMQAYIEAFNTPADEVLTENFLKRINAISASHLHSNQYGNYRTGEIHFKISAELRKDPDQPELNFYSLTYNVNNSGLAHFIDTWLVKRNSNIHQIMIDPKKNKTTSRAYVIAAFGPGQPLCFCTSINDTPIDVVDYNEDVHLPFLHKLITNNNYQFTINVATANSHQKTRALLSCLTNTFLMLARQELVAANNDDEKIVAIAKLAQSIDQLHPFPGGNIRTCYVLINKLLHDNNMPLCIFLNPNRLDCCDLNEVVRSINEGQYVYQSWLQNSNPNEFTLRLPKPLATQRSATFVGYTYTCSIADDFYNLVKPQIEAPTANVSRQSIFAVDNQQHIESAKLKINTMLEKVASPEHRVSMQNALQKEAFSLLLRRACAYQAFGILDILLPLKNILNVDINEISASSNRTALDWLETCPDSRRKEQAKALLIENGGLARTSLNCK